MKIEIVHLKNYYPTYEYYCDVMDEKDKIIYNTEEYYDYTDICEMENLTDEYWIAA